MLHLLSILFLFLYHPASIAQAQRPGTPVIQEELAQWNARNTSGSHENQNEEGDVRQRNILFVVGNSSDLNTSEQQIQARLKGKGYQVLIVNDDVAFQNKNSTIDLVIVSKTVNSLNVGTKYKNASCGFMTWEDNLQMSQLMGYSENDGSKGTAWHAKYQNWYVVPKAPVALRAGLSGNVKVYASPDEITYSPNDSTVPSSAIVVAELFPGDYHKTYYVFEKGSKLGDGSPAAGRRVYFGLYDDTFRLLNKEGLSLFDAAVDWGSGRP
jgi:hypothetical protein